MVDWPADQFEPRIAELGLKAEAPGGPLCRRPRRGQDDKGDGENLTPEYSRSRHPFLLLERKSDVQHRDYKCSQITGAYPRGVANKNLASSNSVGTHKTHLGLHVLNVAF